MNHDIRKALRAALKFAALLACTATGVLNAAPSALGNAKPIANAIVQQPRPFGYVVGDLLTQRVLLQVEGRDFEPGALPRAERIGVWLERRAPWIESSPDGQRWLALEYQLINAPQALTTVNLPAWEMKAKSGAATLLIGAWPISVTALTPSIAMAQGGVPALRPDRPAPTIVTAPIRRQLWIWLGASTLTLAGWLTWLLWCNWRAASNRPFARALREMHGADETAPEAWQALHRAFDRTAGRVTQTSILPALFRQAPHLEPLRPRIEQFFAQSSERFFGAGLPANPVSVRALCKALRSMEKQHE